MKIFLSAILLVCSIVCSGQPAQTITFNALPAKVLGDAAFTISASASSGLPVTFTSSNPGVATVSGNTITIHAVGSTLIKASQSGNVDFSAASDVSQLLVVKNVAQTPAYQGQLWGTSSEGGVDDIGVLFKTNSDGSSYTVVKEFRVDGNGCFPGSNSQLIPVNGKFYGLTPYGGLNNAGVLFEYDPATNVYTKKIDIASFNGKQPVGSLTLANGKLYGITYQGGPVERGVIFEYDPATSLISKKFDIPAGIGSKGVGGLLLATNGKLYAATRNGVTGGYGGIIEYDPATNTAKGTLTLTLDQGTTMHTLTQAANGKLYGLAEDGGPSGNGTLFEYDPATDVFTKKYDFNYSTDGSHPKGGLLAASDGKLYGMTSVGAANNRGKIFSYVPGATSITGVLTFTSSQGAPSGTLIEGEAGKFYGVDGGDGGRNNPGQFFRFEPATLTYTPQFILTQAGGRNSLGALTLYNGKLYGLASQGGANNAGTIFEYEFVTSTFVKKFDFKYAEDGARPNGTVTQVTNGKLYGITTDGGSENGGVVFEYDPVAETFNKRADFKFLTTGTNPHSSLTLGVNGKLYGLTYNGGSDPIYKNGTLFEFDPTSNNLTNRLNFKSPTTQGVNPNGSLTVAPDGKLWGMTTTGGAENGILFEYNPENNDFTIKHNFLAATGYAPWGSLTLGTNGKFYGLTASGGASDGGVIFEYDPVNNLYTVKSEFTSATGKIPYGNLTQVGNKFYGLTSYEGSSGSRGSLFEFNLETSVLTKKEDFATSNGGWPRGSMVLAENGMLYGLTMIGGAGGHGVFFEFNPATNIYTVKKELAATYGRRPEFSSVMQTVRAIKKDQTITFAALSPKTMGDASFALSATASSTLSVALSATSDKVNITGNQLTLMKPGSITIKANQPGDINYFPAPEVQRTFCIIPAKPTIIMTGENTENVVLTSSSTEGNQWFLNDELIANATAASYTATVAGIYKVKVSVDGCEGEISNPLSLIVTGTMETQKQSITTFPNPVDDKLFVTLPGNQQSRISIIHMDGSVSSQITTSEQMLEINVGHYKQGMYILRVSNGKRSDVTHKFIKR